MESHVDHEQSHPGPLEYIKVALILGVVTAIEVAIYYLEGFKDSAAFVPVLLLLSTFKFGMVVLWFMHLRFDHRVFSIMFFGGLVLAGTVGLALLVLFLIAGNLAGQPPVHA